MRREKVGPELQNKVQQPILCSHSSWLTWAGAAAGPGPPPLSSFARPAEVGLGFQGVRIKSAMREKHPVTFEVQDSAPITTCCAGFKFEVVRTFGISLERPVNRDQASAPHPFATRAEPECAKGQKSGCALTPCAAVRTSI